MDVALFDYDLPEERIALRPASPRDSARMLVVSEDGTLAHAAVRDLPEFLRKGDVLVVNNSKVIPARLHARKIMDDAEGPAVELLLHRRTAPNRFLALARPARKLNPGDRLQITDGFRGTIGTRQDGEVEVIFDLAGEALAADETRDVPVVVLTGNGTPELREECLRAGAEAFVEKPFDVSFVVDIARKAALAKRERERLRGTRKAAEQPHSPN